MSNFSRPWGFAIAFLLAFTQSVFAQSEEETNLESEAESSVDDVDDDFNVTTRQRLAGELEGRPARVERIRSEDLQRRGATNLADALNFLSSGTQISPTGTATGILIDGLPGSQVTVLRDGLPIARPSGSPQGPIIDLRSIPIVPDSIVRIDIYRGVGQTGSGGAGGVVIDIVTKNEQPKTSGFVQAQTGIVDDQVAFDSGIEPYLWSLAGGGTVGFGDHFSADFLLRKFNQSAVDVDQDDSPDGQKRDGLSGEASFKWRPTDNDFLRLSLIWQTEIAENIGQPRSVFDDIVTRRALRVRANARAWLGDNWRLDHGTDVGTSEQVFDKRVKSSNRIRPKSDTSYDDFTTNTAIRYFVGDHDLASEVAVSGYRVERDGETGVLPTRDQVAAGFGVGHTWYATSWLETYERVFGEYSSEYGGAVNAQVAVALKAHELLTLRTTVATSRRAPTPEELYLFFDHSEVGYQVEGNEDLDPERLYSAQLGAIFKTEDDKFGLEVMGFYHRLTDAITITNGDTPGLFTYENRVGAETAGVQSSLQVTLPASIGVVSNYTFMPVARDTDDDSRLVLRPRHAISFEVRKPFFSNKVELWFDGNLRSEVEVPEGSEPASAYTSTIIGAGVRFNPSDSIQLIVDLDNLLNRTNPTWGPVPGRALSLTLVGRLSAD